MVTFQLIVEEVGKRPLQGQTRALEPNNDPGATTILEPDKCPGALQEDCDKEGLGLWSQTRALETDKDPGAERRP